VGIGLRVQGRKLSLASERGNGYRNRFIDGKSSKTYVVGAIAMLLVSCATAPVATTRQLRPSPARVQKSAPQLIRTTKVAAPECDRAAPEERRSKSAASDWSRFPLGTRFRVLPTGEEYIIDDYGGALVGTNTIDLYKPSMLAMRRWGVRHVEIEVLEWGSEEEA
jgi:3D (Asp-Asp-Asp) domain-containing protein